LANITNSAGLAAAQPVNEPAKSKGPKVETKPKFLARPVANRFLDDADEIGQLAGKCGYELDQEAAAAEEKQLQARVQALVECFGSLDRGGNESDCSRDLDTCPLHESAASDLHAWEAFASADLEDLPGLDTHFSCFSDTQSDDTA
jgi:hypothetical protein